MSDIFGKALAIFAVAAIGIGLVAAQFWQGDWHMPWFGGEPQSLDGDDGRQSGFAAMEKMHEAMIAQLKDTNPELAKSMDAMHDAMHGEGTETGSNAFGGCGGFRGSGNSGQGHMGTSNGMGGGMMGSGGRGMMGN